MTAKDYPQMARDINAVGLDNLQQHIRTFHPQAVPKMERNIAMIKYCVVHGPSEAGKLYGVHQSNVSLVLTKYWRYAKEAKREASKTK